MALGGEVVDLIRLHLLYHANQTGTVGHVAVMQDEATVADFRSLVEMIDAVGVEQGRPPLQAMDDVAFFQQQLGEIGAVLTGHAGD